MGNANNLVKEIAKKEDTILILAIINVVQAIFIFILVASHFLQ